MRDNYLCWQNQIKTWCPIIILSIGLVGSYFYVTLDANFVTNPKPSWVVNVGYNYECQLVTLMFLGEGIMLSLVSFIVSQSHPFK